MQFFSAPSEPLESADPLPPPGAGPEFDLDHRRVRVGGHDIGLSPAEFATVHLLFTHRGVPMSKDALAKALPTNTEPIDPRMIDVYICRARAKFANSGLPEAIMTLWGRGYVAGDSDGEDAAPSDPPISGDFEAALALV